jgi:hypothetical protein
LRIAKTTMIGENTAAEIGEKKEKEKLNDDTFPQNLRSQENLNRIIIDLRI